MSNQIIQHEDLHFKWLVHKYPSNNVKKGTELLVRPGQEVVLVYDGQIADCYAPGKYILNDESMPRLFSFGERFTFPRNAVRTDVYFVNTTLFMNNGWGTKDPIICKDTELDLVRLTAFGTFAFQISDAPTFIQTVFGTRLLGTETSETTVYISNSLSESAAIVLSGLEYSVLNMAKHYDEIADMLNEKTSMRLQDIGVTLSEVKVEHIGTSTEVNSSIDEYTGLKIAKRDFKAYKQYTRIKNHR